MSRRETAFCCAVGGFLALLSMGCRRGADTPLREPPEASAGAREAVAARSESAGELPVRPDTQAKRGEAAIDKGELAKARAKIEAILPPGLIVLRTETITIENGSYLLLGVGPQDRVRAHPGFALALWPVSILTPCPWDSGAGTHTFEFIGRSQRHAVYYSGEGGRSPVAHPLMEGVVDRIRAVFSVRTPIAWGEAANGLQAGLVVKHQAGFGAPFGVEIHVRNVGDKALRLYDAGYDSSWRVVFASKGGGMPRRAGRFNIWARQSRAPSYVDLRKGAKKVAVRCTFAGSEWLFADARATGYEAIRRTSINVLPSGIYTVAASYGNTDERPWSKGCWIGKVTTGPAEIEITAKGAAGPAPAKEDTGKAPASVVEKGLSVAVRPAKKVFGPKEPLAFDVTFRNVSEKPFLLFDVEFYPWWRYEFTVVGGANPGRRWEGRCMAKFRRTPPEPIAMRPGESRVVKAVLDDRFMYGRPGGGHMDWSKRLPAGKYRLSIERKLTEFVDWTRLGEHHKPAAAERKWPFPFWTGTIKTRPVEFEIAKGAAP